MLHKKSAACFPPALKRWLTHTRGRCKRCSDETQIHFHNWHVSKETVMNTSSRSNRLLGLAAAGMLAWTAAPNVYGAGTAANTTISNAATINYKVNSIDQDAVTSNTATFKVDRKVNLTVATTEVAAVSVTPGSTGRVLKFTVTNTGNDTFDYTLAATAAAGGAAAFGGTDNINASAVSIYVDGNANGVYNAGVDTATSIDNLAADGAATVFIVANFATGLSNNDIASYHLLVTAKGSDGSALTQDTDGDTAGTVENVFADAQGSDTSNDAARDAKHSAQADYKVSTATLTVSKSSTVISDPINNTTNPLAIPGAVVEYTITISNGAGAATATNIAVTDSLATEIGNGTIAFNTNTYAAGKGIQVTSPNINAGVALALTNAGGGDDQGDWNVTGANTVTVTGISLAAGESATVKFRVTIQ